MPRTNRFLAGVAAIGLIAAIPPVHQLSADAGTIAAGTAKKRPNVVMIMTDDQDAASLSVMKNTRRLLGGQGTTFTNSFVSYSLCCPSRATYLTGQYPHNHGVIGNKQPDGGYYQLRGGETLPVWLSRNQYATAHIGKYLNGYGTRNPKEIPPGWQEWYGSVDPTTYRMWGYTLNENGTLKTYGKQNVLNPKLYQTDVYANKAVDYIKRKAPSSKPFFLSVAPLASHTEGKAKGTETGNPRPAPRHKGKFADRPLPRPKSFNEPDVSDKPKHIRKKKMGKKVIQTVTRNHRARLESLLAVDEAIAKIVSTLKKHGELNNTLIMFTSDNGWMRGQHRIPNGKVVPYEPSIRVPLVVRGPGVPKNKKSAAPVSNIDLAPTILDAANAKPGIRVDGDSLLARPKAKRPLLVETGPKRSNARWYAAIRTKRYVYVEHSTTEKELYDLKTDPQQLRSRHADPAYEKIRKDLAKRLHKLQKCAGASCS